MFTFGINIAPEAVATIAGVAAVGIKGVHSLGSANVVSGLINIAKKNEYKGIKVAVKEDSIKIEMHIIVDYGCNITEVAEKVQENVREDVETQTGFTSISVDVCVDDLYINAE